MGSADLHQSEPVEVPLRDLSPRRDHFLADVLEGLRAQQKQLPCKYFYDERGSSLFEEICSLEEYYPTRTELGIMQTSAAEMAEALGPHCLLVEYGSGSGAKTRLLLDHLERPAAYVPVDISREHLLQTARALAREYPALEVLPICADFTRPFELPLPERRAARRAVYFPGSTIGNFSRASATRLLRGVARLCGSGGLLLIGVDLEKEHTILERAYDDARGVTAAFNRNLLVRMNRELGADFEPERFRHRAVWVPAGGRVEMHLVSDVAQQVHLGGETIRFEAGEAVCTEYAHKYTLEGFAAVAARAGLSVQRVWRDPEGLFSVQAFVVE